MMVRGSEIRGTRTEETFLKRGYTVSTPVDLDESLQVGLMERTKVGTLV